MTTNKQLLSLFGLVSATIVWGFTFILVKWTVAEMDVFYFLFLRFFLAFLCLGLLFIKEIRFIDWKTIKASFYLSLLLGAAFLTQTEGLRHTTATNSAMITGLYIVMIPIVSSFLHKAKISRTTWTAALISLLGLYLLTGYHFQGVNPGDKLTLLCAMACTGHIILTGRLTMKHKAPLLVLLQLLFLSMIFGGMALFKGSLTVRIPPIGWLTILITALFATSLAFWVQTVAQRHIEVSRVGIIFGLESVFGALFAWWLGGEFLTGRSFFGACLMIGGIVVSEMASLLKLIGTSQKCPDARLPINSRLRRT